MTVRREVIPSPPAARRSQLPVEHERIDHITGNAGIDTLLVNGVDDIWVL